MPGSKSYRREDKNRRSCNSTKKLFSLGDRAKSFHGRSCTGPITETLLRPRTVPDLLHVSGFAPGTAVAEEVRVVRLTKVLLNVTVQRSLGPVQVLMAPESTVGELIVATLLQCKKERRRPVLGSDDAIAFDLHYSQFTLESLARDEKLITLGSRNFFLFPKTSTSATESSSGSAGSLSTSPCSEQAERTKKIHVPWLKFLF